MDPDPQPCWHVQITHFFRGMCTVPYPTLQCDMDPEIPEKWDTYPTIIFSVLNTAMIRSCGFILVVVDLFAERLEIKIMKSFCSVLLFRVQAVRRWGQAAVPLCRLWHLSGRYRTIVVLPVPYPKDPWHFATDTTCHSMPIWIRLHILLFYAIAKIFNLTLR